MNVDNTVTTPWQNHFVLLCLLAINPVLHVFAQGRLSLVCSEMDLHFEHLTREDGLPSNAINSIFQDSRGFMWFGTKDGLARYDGYNFKIFKHDPNDPKSLSFNDVSTIFEDKEGVLWVGTNVGLNKFDRKNENFKSYLPESENNSGISHPGIKAIFEDHSGRFWIGTWNGGLNSMNRENEVFVQYQHHPGDPRSLSSNIITGIAEDPNQPEILWIGTYGQGSLHGQFNTIYQSFIPIQLHLSGTQGAGHELITSVYKDQSGTIWLTTKCGLDRFDPEKEGFITYNHEPGNPHSLSHNHVTSIFEDQEGGMWVGTYGGGLDRFNRELNTFSHYRHDPQEPKSLSSNKVTTVFEDPSGILWIGTADGGINYTYRKKQKFPHFKHDPGKEGSISDNVVSAIYQDRAGTLWIGTANGGLNYFDEKTDEFRHFKHESGNLHNLSHNFIWTICEDQEGIIWIGTNSGGLNRFDKKTGQFKWYKNDPDDPNSLSGNYVTAVHESSDQTLWVATLSGLQQFDRKKQQFRNFNIFDEEQEIKMFMCIYEDRSSNIWVGSEAGLFCIGRDKGIVRRFLHEKDEPNSLSSSHIRSILEDRTGSIWVGTMGGLNKIIFPEGEKSDSSKIMIRRYTEKDGLPSNNIAGILEDNRGRLWISTRNGLSVLWNPHHVEGSLPDFKNYDVEDGLQAYEFSAGAYFKNTNGEMFFGGPGGFNAFHPDSIWNNPFLPPVVITAFEKFDKGKPDQGAILEPGISEKREIKLSHRNNIFSIEFVALNYREPNDNRYAYKLEGFNDNWIQLGERRLVTFTNLDPGVYTFHVKGANNDGIWNEKSNSLKITISTPWWKTWWAYSTYILSISLVIYLIRRYELNHQRLRHNLELEQVLVAQERREARRLKELDHIKSRFFANISHGFRTPLTLILGPLENLISNCVTGDVCQQYLLMKRNAQQLLRLINQLLDLSKLDAGKMSLKARCDDIIPLIKGVFYSFESSFERKGIRLQFETNMETALLYFDYDKIEQIITNVLSNALKFTPEGGVVTLKLKKFKKIKSIRREHPDGFLQIKIADTGPGISAVHLPYIFNRFYQANDTDNKEMQGSGIGLALTKELVELHHGLIKVYSKPGKGSQFSILLPFGKSHLSPGEIVEVLTARQLSAIEKSVIRIRDAGDRSNASWSVSYPGPSPLINKEEMERENIILLVEDNTDMRLFIRNQLGHTYKIVEAANGQQGIEMAIQFIPDLIISDVMMPVKDGLQLCNTLKTDERTSHIPIILLTARADLASRLAGLERGADAYLSKPFNRKELLVRIRKMLELRQRLRDRYTTLGTPAPASDPGIQMEDAFLQKILQIIEEHISNIDFNIDQLSQIAGMSRSQLFRKIKALTGKPPSLYIRTIRLNKGKELLQTTDLNVSEVAYDVGFSTPAYFSDVFLETYGVRPSELRR